MQKPPDPLHRCKRPVYRIKLSRSQAQAWIPIDDLPTRQSNWAAPLNRLSSHFLTQVSHLLPVLDSVPVLGNNEHASKKGKAHSLRPWSATPFLPSSLRQSATHLCQLQPRTDSLRRLPYLPTTLLRLIYVLLCVHICLAATVHGVPALIVNGRSLMLTSLLPWTAPRAAEDCCGSHRYTDAHRAFNRLNFRRMMYI